MNTTSATTKPTSTSGSVSAESRRFSTMKPSTPTAANNSSDLNESANRLVDAEGKSTTANTSINDKSPVQDEMVPDSQPPLDSNEAQENVHNAVLVEPEEAASADCSANFDSECDAGDDQEDSSESRLLQATENGANSSLERRAFREEEIKRIRGQRNKSLGLRPNLKRKKKRRKSNGGANRMTRQSTTTVGYGNLHDWPVVGAINQITSATKQHFPTLASPLNLSSTVQKLIMSKFSNPAGKQQNTRLRHQQQLFAGGQPQANSIFYQQASGFADNQRGQPTQPDLLNQWASSDMSASAYESNARAKQVGAKLIPIEIIGLDPMITKSILETNSAALDHGPASAESGKSFASQMEADDSSAALKQLTSGGPKPIPSSIVHIHHFHTQAAAAAAAAAAAKQQVSGTYESGGPQDGSVALLREHISGGGENPPDVHIVNPSQQQQKLPSDSRAKQQQAAGQQQQVYMNDRGELVYMPGDFAGGGQAAANSAAEPQQDPAAPSGTEQPSQSSNSLVSPGAASGGQLVESQRAETSPSESANLMGDHQGQRPLANDNSASQDKLAGESVNPVHQAAAIQQPGTLSKAAQFTPPIRHEGHNHSATYFMQPFMRAQQVVPSSSHTMLGSGGGHDQRRQRVFLTTNGQTISLVSGHQPHQNVIGGDDELAGKGKLLMVAYKPQQQQPYGHHHLSQFRNVSSTDDLLVSGRNPYNEGQESKASMISSGAHQLLRGAGLLAGSNQQQQNQVPTTFDQFDSDLAIMRPAQHTNGSGLPGSRQNWTNTLLVGETLNDRAKINSQLTRLRGGSTHPLDNRVPSMSITSFVNTNLENLRHLSSGNSTIGNSKAGPGSEELTSFRATWLEPASEDLIKPPNGHEGFLSNNNTLSALLNATNPNIGGNSSVHLTQLPPQIINILRSTTHNSKLANDEVLRRLLQEIKLRNGSSGFGLSVPNKNFTTTAAAANDKSRLHSSMQLGGHQMMLLNNSDKIYGSLNGFHPPMQKIVNNPSNIVNIKEHNKLNNIIEPHEIRTSAAAAGGGLQAQVKQRQPVGVALIEESDFGDTTNGLSNIALAFIFVVSLLTLTIIAASMIYRYRRRSIGRCAELPAKSRLNITQRTKRFVRSNFSGTNNQEAASIKSINVDLGGTNTMSRAKGSAVRKESLGACVATAGNNCRLGDRYTIKPQTFGQVTMSTFNTGTLTSSSQFTDDSPSSSGIKPLNTKLQKSNYLKSLISPSECLAGQQVSHTTINNKHPTQAVLQQKHHQQQIFLDRPKPTLDNSCYLGARHGAMDSMAPPKARIPIKCKSPHDDHRKRSHSFKNISSQGDSYHQNYSFAFKSPPNHHQRYNDGSSIDSREKGSNRMSTIHSVSENDPKSTLSDSHHEQRDAPNISYGAGKMNNLMAPKHVVAPLPEATVMDNSRTRFTEMAQIDRL